MGGDTHRLLLARRGNGGRHQRIVDAGGPAERAFERSLGPLLLEGLGAREPALEFVAMAAGQRETDHEPVLSNTGVGACGGAKGRSFFSAGMRWRTASE